MATKGVVVEGRTAVWAEAQELDPVSKGWTCIDSTGATGTAEVGQSRFEATLTSAGTVGVAVGREIAVREVYRFNIEAEDERSSIIVAHFRGGHTAQGAISSERFGALGVRGRPPMFASW